ncbi:Uncharacterized ATP-dependent helicase C17A2.12 [Seminavis robusta]|uniref:Uncharacterized ATP-dependent helicase C17A2.12 n=1 Tax=Seminavis robusta TaxID=568900 RepID=A0A9N8HID6_9STRA|nr:Uncharacterized ATP-dependent helicase C17A2.12 [Seminavis robusta]|eukprot:Sro588_g171530.1 Uncharacterized ATP-dependent helicase C17A2.12 (1533) ;mRNA; r:30330-35085
MASLQGNVLVIPLPSLPNQSLGILIDTSYLEQENTGTAPYPTVISVHNYSVLRDQVQPGDVLMSLGSRNLLGVSLRQIRETVTSNVGGSLVVLRPNGSSTGSATMTPTTTATIPESARKIPPNDPSQATQNDSTPTVPSNAASVPPVAAKVTPAARDTPTGKKDDVIELLSSSSDEEDTITGIKTCGGTSNKVTATMKHENVGDEILLAEQNATKRIKQEGNSSNAEISPLPTKTASTVLPETLSIPPTLFSQGKAKFPLTIDTQFTGKLGNAETPVPNIDGAFYEELHTASGNTRKKRSVKTWSRVARLAGTFKVQVQHNEGFVSEICNNTTELVRYVLAEDLLKAQSENPDRLIFSQKACDILSAISNLNDLQNPFQERCVYAIAEAPSPKFETPPVVAELKFYVYFRRALFGLAANANITTLLDALAPNDTENNMWVPCRQVPMSTNQYERSDRPTDGSKRAERQFEYSLAGLLWHTESTGYPLSSAVADRDYQGVNVELRDYQKESVSWMIDQENRDRTKTGGGVAGLNGYFWERRTLEDGEEFFYFPLGGQILLNPPPIATGGLLAEEMGLGKTVITLELICSDVKSKPPNRGGTLCVLPVSLLSQWEEEISSKANHLSVFVYNGDSARDLHEKHRSMVAVAKELSQFDIILATMSKLKELTAQRNTNNQRNPNALGHVKFHRLVVDEAQFLKNDTTAIAKAAAAINATHIWMLSGTPLTNKLDDLRGELSLLHVWPFTLGTQTDTGWQDWFWQEAISRQWNEKTGLANPILHKLMSAVAFRHSRMQNRRVDGSPLVELPPRTEEFVAITEDSSSSYSYINCFVAAMAVKILRRFDRFDVRVTGFITKLRQFSSCPSLLVDETENADDFLSQLATLATTKAENTMGGIRQISLRQAIISRKNNKDAVLQELILLARDGPSALTHCLYCKKARAEPAYFRCSHSVCVGCSRTMLEKDGSFDCPVCSDHLTAIDIDAVILPAVATRDSEATGATQRNDAIEVDLNDAAIEEMLSSLQEDVVDDPSPAEASHQQVSTYSLVRQNHFEPSEQQGIVQLAELANHAKPNLTPESESYAEQFYSNDMGPSVKDLVRHAVECSEDLWESPKIKALCETIQSIRDSSLEAKICVFSSFNKVLDIVEEALVTCHYTVEYDMNTNMKLLPGQKVIKREKDGSKGRVVRRSPDRYQPEEPSSGWDVLYEVAWRGRGITANSHVHRNDLLVEPVVVDSVSPKHVRKDPADKKLSVNGSSDRYAVGSKVESRRPAVSSLELQVGYSVLILPVGNVGSPEPGRVVYVHDEGGSVSYDVQPDGYTVSANNEHVRRQVLCLPPSRLQDKGIARWLPARIVEISTKRLTAESISATKTRADPFEHALGYVRLDGGAGDASRRGEILETFKRDPMTSVALLTKTAAGVGLNLTNANYVIVLEPSIDGHDELQSIARIHRIGQTRKVSVLKFYMKGSVEERILSRRQQRGELNVSINTITGVDPAEGEEGATKGKNTVSSSKALAFSDLKFLLGADGSGDGCKIRS